jgi:ADP-heptose:LPS heptosyltransferase
MRRIRSRKRGDDTSADHPGRRSLQQARGAPPGESWAPHNPGDLFIWQTPFKPSVTVRPRPTRWQGSTARRAGQGRDRRPWAFFLGVNLLGDFLCTTPTVRGYRLRHPRAFITYIVHNAPYCRLLDGNPDIDLVLYRDDLYRHGERVLSEEWFWRLPIDIEEPTTLYRFNVHEACRSTPDVFEDHLSWGFARFLQIPIMSVRPIVVLSDQDRALARRFAPRPYIILGMHTTSRVIGQHGDTVVKDWVFDRWLKVARHFVGRGFDVVAIGSERDVQVHSRHFRNLYGLPIKVVAALLQQAACVVTVEGGLSHLCHAVDAPMVVVFSRYVAFHWAFPREATRCRVIYDDPRSIQVEDVIAAADSILHPQELRLS